MERCGTIALVLKLAHTNMALLLSFWLESQHASFFFAILHNQYHSSQQLQPHKHVSPPTKKHTENVQLVAIALIRLLSHALVASCLNCREDSILSWSFRLLYAAPPLLLQHFVCALCTCTANISIRLLSDKKFCAHNHFNHHSLLQIVTKSLDKDQGHKATLALLLHVARIIFGRITQVLNVLAMVLKYPATCKRVALVLATTVELL